MIQLKDDLIINSAWLLNKLPVANYPSKQEEGLKIVYIVAKGAKMALLLLVVYEILTFLFFTKNVYYCLRALFP